jgi:hypothetical protein
MENRGYIKRKIKARNKKEYMKQYHKIYYEENKTGKLQYSANQYSKNREHLLDLRHRRYMRQREEESRRYHEKYLLVKEEIIRLLGGKCTNPYNLFPHPDWCNDKACLQIDHVNGDGYKERKLYPYKVIRVILEKIQSGSKDYQLLCANCNWIKREKNKENNRKILL